MSELGDDKLSRIVDFDNFLLPNPLFVRSVIVTGNLDLNPFACSACPGVVKKMSFTSDKAISLRIKDETSDATKVKVNFNQVSHTIRTIQVKFK